MTPTPSRASKAAIPAPGLTLVWHYAPWSYLPKMVAAGVLRPSNAGAEDEVGLLWFSADQQWEPTATKPLARSDGQIVPMTFTEQAKRFGCVRFGLHSDDPRLLAWAEACKAAGTPRDARRALERAGAKAGASHKNWSAVLHSISLTELQFDVWLGSWQPAEPTEMAAAWIDARGQEWDLAPPIRNPGLRSPW